MKGVVFTEFVEMVEETFSAEVVDELLDSVELPSGGAYTSVGTYEHEELISLVAGLSQRTGIDVVELVYTFGRHLLGQFSAKFPSFFETASVFDFLEQVDGYIHVEVRKLYPDSELPRFVTERKGEVLEMTYISERPFHDLARGLIEGAIESFDESIDVTQHQVSNGVMFVLTQRAEVPVCPS